MPSLGTSRPAEEALGGLGATGLLVSDLQRRQVSKAAAGDKSHSPLSSEAILRYT